MRPRGDGDSPLQVMQQDGTELLNVWRSAQALDGSHPDWIQRSTIGVVRHKLRGWRIPFVGFGELEFHFI